MYRQYRVQYESWKSALYSYSVLCYLTLQNKKNEWLTNHPRINVGEFLIGHETLETIGVFFFKVGKEDPVKLDSLKLFKKISLNSGKKCCFDILVENRNSSPSTLIDILIQCNLLNWFILKISIWKENHNTYWRRIDVE